MESLFNLFGLELRSWEYAVSALIIFGSSLLLAVLSHYVIIPLAQRVSHRTETELDDLVFRAARRPVSFIIMVLGSYLAIIIPLDLTETQLRIVNSLFAAVAILSVIILIARLLSVFLDWYIARLHVDQRSAGAHILPRLRKMVVAVLYVIGVLLILGTLGIPISPLIAGLGLGGVAVALAIQPTLANMFAGTYVVTENIISPGDYIEMEGGVSGYVIEVSLRSTRIRTWENKLVVIPNSRLVDTIVTNHSEPTPPVNVFLTCGVSYDSNLARVEEVSMDVMDSVLETSPHGVKEYGAYFGFDNFGESNVDFWLFVQARDRLASFELRSALIYELHRRFDEEGIVINYPVRSLQFPNGSPPEEIARFATVRSPAMVQRTAHPDTPSPDIAGGEGGGDGPDGPA